MLVREDKLVLVECKSKHKQTEDGVKWDIFIKLNPHITIYPVEEKMVPISLIEKAWWAGFDRSSYLHDVPNAKEVPHIEKWFEQNVK